ncbi:MAG: hypothetical protein MUF52_04105 [Syntrophobacteraceae bacterium]|jgi:hypothetical protein|nr:hypothetical protein [Syntrophobacteraceae bacterium]
MDTSNAMAGSYRQAKLVAWAMMGTVVIHAAIVEILLIQGVSVSGVDPEAVAPYKDYFILGGVLAFVIIRAVRTSILRQAPGDSVATLLGRLRTANIAVYAIAEIPAILGLVLFILTGDRKDFYILGTFSILAMVLYYPKLNHWEVWLQRKA